MHTPVRMSKTVQCFSERLSVPEAFRTRIVDARHDNFDEGKFDI